MVGRNNSIIPNCDFLMPVFQYNWYLREFIVMILKSLAKSLAFLRISIWGVFEDDPPNPFCVQWNTH